LNETSPTHFPVQRPPPKPTKHQTYTSPEYAALKEERSQVLWAAVEKIIPDIRQRTELSLVGGDELVDEFMDTLLCRCSGMR
jgi:hypothetical protein